MHLGQRGFLQSLIVGEDYLHVYMLCVHVWDAGQVEVTRETSCANLDNNIPSKVS